MTFVASFFVPLPSPIPFMRSLLGELTHAAARMDREAVALLSDELAAAVRAGRAIRPRAARRVLDVLRGRRFFAEMIVVARALLAVGGHGPDIRRLLVQAFVDTRRLDRACASLRPLLRDDSLPRAEWAQVQGLYGRILKQRYVDAPDGQRDPALLRRALEAYRAVYNARQPATAWHAVNLVALLRRARKDGVHLDGYPRGSEVSRRLRASVTRRGTQMTGWDMETAMEAALGIGDAADAARWAKGFAAHPGVSAFELASAIRQLEEVWELRATEGPGAMLLPVLRTALLLREDGAIRISSEEVRHGSGPDLEAIYGRSQPFVTLDWYARGMKRARGVCRISNPARYGVNGGTGFLLRAGALSSSLPDGWVVLTNDHVVNDGGRRRGIPSADAVVTFEALASRPQGHAVAEVLWHSPVDRLDTTVLRLREPPKGAGSLDPYPIASRPPKEPEVERIYAIGHPAAQPLSFSLNDNEFLDYRGDRMHYRTPTEGGSSGSPLFNDEWKLIGLHRAGLGEVEMLSDRTRRHQANEGIWIQALREAIAANPPPAEG